MAARSSGVSSMAGSRQTSIRYLIVVSFPPTRTTNPNRRDGQGRGQVLSQPPVSFLSMADEPVHVCHYDPAWPARFADQRDRVSAVLAQWLAAPVEHIGSTSVPGLPAKPIIDILAPVDSLAGAQDAVPPLQDDGWVFWPEDPCRYYRLWFLRPQPEARTHHLHVIEHGHPQARALRAFRDALRADPGLRTRYADLRNRSRASNATTGTPTPTPRLTSLRASCAPPGSASRHGTACPSSASRAEASSRQGHSAGTAADRLSGPDDTGPTAPARRHRPDGLTHAASAGARRNRRPPRPLAPGKRRPWPG